MGQDRPTEGANGLSSLRQNIGADQIHTRVRIPMILICCWLGLVSVLCIHYSSSAAVLAAFLWFGTLLHSFYTMYLIFRELSSRTRFSDMVARISEFQPQTFESVKTREYYSWIHGAMTSSRSHQFRRISYRRWRCGLCLIGPPPACEFSPQGECWSQFTQNFSKLAGIKGFPVSDSLLSKIEDLGALFLAMRECASPVQGFAIMFLYIKTHYGKSLAFQLGHYIAELFNGSFNPQTGEFVPQTGEFGEVERPEWLSILKECQENWTLAIRNPGFKKLSRVLSLCLALGLCQASSLDFRVQGMKLFTISAYVKHANAVDLIDAAFDTVVYFAEGGYMCFERGSIKPLLYGNLENEEFETMFARCMRCDLYAKSGNLQKFENLDENDYAALLERTMERCNILINQASGPVEKNILRRKLDTIQMWRASFFQTRVQGGLRVAPYSIGVFGGTAVGKSSVANTVLVLTLMMNGYAATDDRVITLNESDKFWSNYRTFINGVLVDDLNNTKADFVERAPTSLMIQLKNNIRYYANMAESAQKGSVSIEPKVLVSTKNVKDGGAHTYSNEPASITRRDDIILTVHVKPEYCSFGMLDQTKVRDLCPELFASGPWRCPDLWNIRVERSFPIRSQHTGGKATVGYRVVEDEEGEMSTVSMPRLLRFIKKDSADFYKNQEDLVESNTDVAGKVALCPHCSLPWPDVCACELPAFHLDDLGRAVLNAPKSEDSKCEFENQIGEISPEAAVAADGLLLLANEVASVDDDISISTLYTDSYSFDSSADERFWSDDDSVYSIVGVDDFSESSILEDTDAELFYDELDNEVWEFSPQLGEYLAFALVSRFRQKRDYWWPRLNLWVADREESLTRFVIRRLEWLETSRWTRWTNYVPNDWFDNPLFQQFHCFIDVHILQRNIRRRKVCGIASVILSLCLFPFFPLVSGLMMLYFMLDIAQAVEKEKKLLYDRAAADNAAMPEVMKLYRDRHMRWITLSCATIAVLVGMAYLWKAMKAVPVEQGNLMPKEDKEMEQRNSEVNPWAEVVVSPMPCTEKSGTTTISGLGSLIQGNLCHMQLEGEINGVTRYFACDAFFPCSNVAIVPTHMWRTDSWKAKFIRHDPDSIGGNFSCYLDRSTSFDIPGTDMSLTWVPNGGDWKNMVDYFPLERFRDVPGRLIFRKEDGSIISSGLQMKCRDVGTYKLFPGASYHLDFDTFDGLCMAPVITDTRGSMIGGFHLGGNPDSTYGCCGLLTKPQLLQALKTLSKKDGVILSKSSGQMFEEQLGVKYFTGARVHPKSPINYLPKGANCRFYGECIGRATYHSDVITTKISPIVEKVCGVGQLWGKPKFNVGYPWQASLSHSTNTSIGVEGKLLRMAVRDYLSVLKPAILRSKYLRNHIKPLTRMETVCGIDGLRFVDAMKRGTSIGYPLSGPKVNYMEFLDPEDHPSHQCPVAVDQQFWDVADDMKALYRKGERAYPIFKACLKDEPTKLSKDKVRVFQGAPMALQLLVREYFLPVARALSMLPLLSECAVGINAQGPEWDQLSRHMEKYGKNRILAGDYSKYDLRMPAQLMFAAFRIMIDIAKSSGYSDDDVCIMEGIATDVCYPLMAYNGDLVQHFGSNPSGQNLTVYINSIVNSLLMRCAFFHIVKRRRAPSFRSVCALVTYGDDVKGSVSIGYPEFNHLSVAEFLAQHDMVFTMPDKESTPTAYMDSADADFLKRKSVWIPDLGVYVGALDEMSIFKSLHAILANNDTMESQCAINIDGAVREWFFHGREIYEKRRAEMRLVAEEADILGYCNELTVSYDERMNRYKEQYYPEEEES